jgi:MFS family permease
VIGLGVSAIVPLAWSSAARTEHTAPGRAIAAVATCGYLGFLVGPILVGALATTIGLAPAVVAAGALIVIVGVLAPSMRIQAIGAGQTNS